MSSISKQSADEIYNDEPVYYCKHCLSLAIKDIGIGDCCADCGSMSIGQASLSEYDRLYEAKYGDRVFFKNKNYGREQKTNE